MDKQAYEYTVGLALKAREGFSKRAEDMNAPAMVGDWVDPRSKVQNEYAKQLKENANKTIGPVLNNGTPVFYDGKMQYKFIPGWRKSFIGSTNKGVFNTSGEPITIEQLLDMRRGQARSVADDMFDRHTTQHSDAKKYLEARGAENHQRYKDGTLWKNEPSKVPMPKTISQPDKIKQLDAAGAGMANARIPGYTKNNIVG